MYDRLHLIRRGMAFAGDCQQKYAEHISKKPEDAEKFLRHIAARFQSPGAIILLTVTLLSFVTILIGVEYTVRFVATTLAITEHTTSNGRIMLTDEPDAPLYKAQLLDDIEGEQKLPVPEEGAALPLPVKPITAGLRSTMRFLHSQGGFAARFRGIKFGIFYLVFMGMFSIIFQALFGALLGPLGFWLGSTVAAIFTCNAHATWTHAMIAAPSDKPFFQRFLPVGVAKQLIMPTVRLHAQIGLMHFAVMSTAFVAGRRLEASQFRHGSPLLFVPFFLTIVLGLGAVIPSYIALIRVEASLLPEDMSAIIPFDRTFGGRMLQTSEVSKCRFAKLRGITLRGAYMSFDRDTYRRTVRMLAKFVLVIAAFWFAFVALLATEFYVIVGGKHNIRKLLQIADGVARGDL